MDLATITKSLGEIGEAAKASGLKVDKQLGELKQYTTDTDARILHLEQLVAKSKGAPGGLFAGGGAGLPNIGKLIADDEAFAALRAGKAQSANIELKQSLRMITKAVLTNAGQSGDSPQIGFPGPTEFLTPAPIQAPGRRLLVLQALPHRPVGGASATVYQVESATDGASVQSHEAAGKTESIINVDGELMPLPTIATYLNLSKQVLQDNEAAIVPFLNSYLEFYVLRKLEQLVCQGTGNSTDKILGLLYGGTAFTPTEDHGIDRIAEAIAVGLPANGYSGTLIILNPLDYVRVLAQRDSNGRYVGGGWQAGLNSTLWGVPAVSSPGVPAGNAIVLDTALVEILDREAVNVQIGFVNAQFTSNEATVLVEGRWNLAIHDKNAVLVVPLPVNSPNTVG
jgi:HK97 family phage major capsid protein